jgi:hypothetical protein
MRWFRVGLSVGVLSSLLGGCVPLWEPDVTRVIEVPVETLLSPLFWKVVALGGLAFLLRMALAVRAPMMSPARWMGFLVVSLGVQVLLSRTFMGTWAYMAVESLSSLAGIGPVVLVGLGLIVGLRKEFAGVFPVLLYFVYRDESLLRFVAIPAFSAHAADALYLVARLKHHLSQATTPHS